MTNSSSSIDEAYALSQDAFALMAQQRIPPTPENYALWFAFVENQNPHLRQAMESWLQSGAPYTNALRDEWRKRFLRQEPSAESYHLIGERFGSELERLSQSLETAGEATSIFGNTLRGAAGALGTDIANVPVKSIVDKLILATRHMESRSRALEQRLQESTSEVRLLREDMESIRRQAQTDQLTGLANRKCFDDRLRAAIDDAMASNTPLSLLMGDIDHFKNFNDTWGHQTGDQVLRLVGRCLMENTKGRDTAARYGGEEFAVLLPTTAVDDAVKVADQIRRSVQTKKVIKRSTGATLGTITLSIGAAVYRPGEDPSQLVERADAALYAAKRSGRNCVRSEKDADNAPLLPMDPPLAAQPTRMN